MTRKSIFLKIAVAALFPLSLLGCKEKVDINLNNGNNNGGHTGGDSITIDTTYMAAVEAPQWRRVLIEEFTGVSCPPCPKGHQMLDAILQSHYNATTGIDSVSVIGIQSNGIPQAEPVNEGIYHSKHDNRTADGSEIYNSIYGTFGSIPRAGIDRVPVGGNLAMSKDYWTSTVNARLRTSTPVNITLSSQYIDSSRSVVIKVHVAYTSQVSKNQSLNLALIETDIYDAQKNDLEIDSMYHHQHVLRDMLTPPTGMAILSSVPVKEAGRVYEHIFTYTVDENWVPEKCSLIAYVTNNEGTDREVQQCAEIPLK